MFIYEKAGKLNVQFGPGQIPVEQPDIVFEKVENRMFLGNPFPTIVFDDQRRPGRQSPIFVGLLDEISSRP